MEKLNNGKKNTSKVYYLNEENKKKLKNLDNVVYSKEKDYALVYTNEDLMYIKMLFMAESDKRTRGRRFSYGKIFKYKMIHTDYNKYDLVFDFKVFSAGVYFNKKDSIEIGSDVMFVFGEADKGTEKESVLIFSLEWG